MEPLRRGPELGYIPFFLYESMCRESLPCRSFFSFGGTLIGLECHIKQQKLQLNHVKFCLGQFGRLTASAFLNHCTFLVAHGSIPATLRVYLIAGLSQTAQVQYTVEDMDSAVVEELSKEVAGISIGRIKLPIEAWKREQSHPETHGIIYSTSGSFMLLTAKF